MYNQKRSLTYNSLVGFLVLALLIIPVLDIVSALIASPQDKCAIELEQAENKYQLGELDEVIELVNRCLVKGDVNVEEMEKAYKLLGKAYHAKGLLKQAKENLRKLLKLIPNWRPSPDMDTPSFQRLAEEVISEMEQKKPTEPAIEEPQREEVVETEQPKQEPVVETTQRPQKGGSRAKLWMAIGGTVLVGTVAAIALSGGGENGKGSIRVTW